MKTIYESILIQAIQWEGNAGDITVIGKIQDGCSSYTGELYLPHYTLNKILGTLSKNGYEIDMESQWCEVRMPDGDVLYRIEMAAYADRSPVLPFAVLPQEHKLLRA